MVDQTFDYIRDSYGVPAAKGASMTNQGDWWRVRPKYKEQQIVYFYRDQRVRAGEIQWIDADFATDGKMWVFYNLIYLVDGQEERIRLAESRCFATAEQVVVPCTRS